MRRIILLAALMAAPVIAAAGDRTDSLKNCKLRYPASPGFVNACHQRNMASRKTLRKLERDGHRDVVAACKRVNPGALRGTDYSATLWCVEDALKAARRQ